MPIDGIVVRNIVHELKTNILGSKIDKIYQPEKDEVIIGIRSSSCSCKLLLTCNPSYPRIHLTEYTKENPKTAPNFCMVLRKHISGGKIVNITQPSLERIVEIHIESPNQIGDLTIKKLIIEIMGKHSNIMLVDENNKILDSIKHITEDISSVREVLPNLTYIYPPCEKLNPITISQAGFYNIFGSLNNENIQKAIINNFTGFGNLIAQEIVHRYSLGVKSSQNVDINKLWHEFSVIISDIDNNSYTPAMYIDSSNDKPIDFSSVKIFEYHDYSSFESESISKIIEKFYYEKDTKDRMNQKTHELRKNIQVLVDRIIKKTEKLQEKIIECHDKEKYKIMGDLIFANIHNINSNENEIRVPNFYSNNCEILVIPLDNTLTPSQNAQKYYKSYNKLKNAETNAHELLEKAQLERDYLESVLVNIENCTTLDDISLIKLELEDEGYIKKTNLKRKIIEVSKPLSFISTDGFTILVGRNNIQNDQLTLKTAENNDLWLHTKQIHGSHVIIKTQNKKVPDTTLIEAGMIAAYFSKAKESSNVLVDYTTVKNVKKPKGAKPGMVIYVEYNTIVVTPDAALIEKLKNK